MIEIIYVEPAINNIATTNILEPKVTRRPSFATEALISEMTTVKSIINRTKNMRPSQAIYLLRFSYLLKHFLIKIKNFLYVAYYHK